MGVLHGGGGCAGAGDARDRGMGGVSIEHVITIDESVYLVALTTVVIWALVRLLGPT